jgi:hypothetical protein
MERAIDTLRSAPNAEKAPYLRALSTVACGDEELCELKRVCVGAYTRHLQALERLAELKSASNQGPGNTAGIENTRAQLVQAGREAQHCVTLQAEARQRAQGK